MHQQLRNNIEKIVPLTDQEFAFVSKHFVHKSFKKHQLMVEVDEPVPCNHYLVKGLTKLVYTDQLAKQHILAFAMEDWWDTDLTAYLNRTRATLSMECLEDTEALSLPLDNYNALREGLPKMERFFLERTLRGFTAAQSRILSLMTSSAQERYERLIRQYPALLQRVPKTHLAAYLGVSRETLSRLTF